MYINGYQCDNCDKISNSGSNELPKGWYKVQEQDKPNRHFCSISCLYQWSCNEVRESERQWEYTPKEQPKE